MFSKDGEIVGNFEDMSMVVEERMFIEKRNNGVYKSARLLSYMTIKLVISEET